MSARRQHLRVVPDPAPAPEQIAVAMSRHPSAVASTVVAALADGVTTWHCHDDGSVHVVFTPAADQAVRALINWRTS